jgi:hypothetical protein
MELNEAAPIEVTATQLQLNTWDTKKLNFQATEQTSLLKIKCCPFLRIKQKYLFFPFAFLVNIIIRIYKQSSCNLKKRKTN